MCLLLTYPTPIGLIERNREWHIGHIGHIHTRNPPTPSQTTTRVRVVARQALPRLYSNAHKAHGNSKVLKRDILMAGKTHGKRTDERLLAIVRVDATSLLVELADLLLAVQHADKLYLWYNSVISVGRRDKQVGLAHHTL